MDVAEVRSGRRVGHSAVFADNVQPQKLLLISSPKGGSGKTTLARNLAVAAALDGLKVATVDLDRQQSLTRWWSKRPETFTLIDHFLAEINDIGAILSEIKDYNLCIVDTPPAIENYPEQIQALIGAANLILLPCQPSDDDTDSVVPWMEFIARSKKPAAFVLNRVRRNTLSLRTAKLTLLKAGRLCPMEIPHTEDVNRSRSLGVGIIEIRNGQGAEEMSGVWAFVRSEMGL
jgi:chromosome partitioning protein